ncbi:probable rRNA maturation factor [Ruaniaceae bacterium KH17]|nr:probable rRNA maturation factor [Ruaniaceae bacterium KH17]
MSTEVINESSYEVDEEEFAAVARFVADAMYLHPQVEMTIMFVDEDEMEQLHVRWLDLPGPTDVMSFPMDELRPGRDGHLVPSGMLGDVVICPAVAAQQARVAGHSTVEEMLLLCIHGILHLLGFDHAEPEDEKEMFAIQRSLLLNFLAQR